MSVYAIPTLNAYEWQRPVISIRSSPPGSSTRGDTYLVGVSPTGAWTGQAGNIAVYLSDSNWFFIPSREGMVIYVKSLQKFIARVGTNWTVTNIV